MIAQEKFIIPQKYDGLGRFSEGLAPVRIGEKSGYLNKNNQIVIPAQFDLASYFSEGLAVVKLNGKWGYIDKNGKVVINPQFDLYYDDPAYSSFSEGLAAVQFENNKWGFIDKTGAIVINPQFDHATEFSNGISAVSLSRKNAYIDKNGKTIWEETK